MSRPKLIRIFVCSTLMFSCSHPNPHVMGGGYDVSCLCLKDSITKTFDMGSKYAPYDSNLVNPIYQDSCNNLKIWNGYDSRSVIVITL